MTVVLRVVAWDHERCLGPFSAAAAEWQRRRPDVRVEVRTRSGHSFAEGPIPEVARDIDLISFDYPFVGSIARERSLVPYEELLPPETLAALAADAIGSSHLSYAWDGAQWGLATDAACQVSLVRDDLLAPRAAPTTWDEALELGREAPARVTTSLATHDAICAFLTICANHGTPVEPTEERFADRDAALRALAWLSDFARVCHPTAFTGWVLATMTETDDVVYGLLQWGYTNYSRPSWRGRRVRYLDIPSAGDGPVGSTLGGAGLGVSAWSEHPHEAAEFAVWLTGPEAQRDIVFPAGGQPGSRSVWDDDALDEASGRFFSGTRATIQSACVRPCNPWWPVVQRDGGAAIQTGLRERREPDAILADLERIYAAAREACAD